MLETDLYRNRDFISDFDAIMAETAKRSLELSTHVKMHKDLAYGQSPREKLDIIFPSGSEKGAPLHMFIHGGYWRAGNKDDHTLIAAPVIEAGGIAAIIGYDLMPDTRLAEIVAQTRKAALFLQGKASELGADPNRFTASGHSAGAHLASLLAAQAPGDIHHPHLPKMQGLFLVSGIYDLAEIPNSFLRHEAEMCADEAAAWSPLSARHLQVPQRIITRGSEETEPFHNQAQALHEQIQDNGMVSTLRNEASKNHLTIVLDLADTNRPLGQCLADFVANS